MTGLLAVAVKLERSGVDGLLLVGGLLRGTTLGADSESTEGAAEGTRSEESLETHAWSEFLSESTLLELILEGESTEGGRSEDLFVENLTFSLERLNGLGGLDVSDFTTDLNAASDFVLWALSLELTENLVLETSLELVLNLKLVVELDLTLVFKLGAGLKLVVVLELTWGLVLEASLKLILDFELTTVATEWVSLGAIASVTEDVVLLAVA